MRGVDCHGLSGDTHLAGDLAEVVERADVGGDDIAHGVFIEATDVAVDGESTIRNN